MRKISTQKNFPFERLLHPCKYYISKI